MNERAMDVEEIHTILRGATRVLAHLQTGKVYESVEGANFDITLKWFKRCGIIDNKLVSEYMFVKAYERLAPNREDLTLAQMVTLFSIFARETRMSVDYFALKFEQCKEDIVDEIREHWMKLDEKLGTKQDINSDVFGSEQ